MKCVHCGTEFADGMSNCPTCGAPAALGQPGAQGQPYGGGVGYASPNMTKKEFLRHPNLKKTKSGITSAAILAYICGVLTFGVSLLLTDTGMFALIDLVLLVGLGLGIQLGQSRACSIILLIYSAFSVISGLIASGSPSGYLVLIAAIDAVIATFRFQKAWKDYQNTGILPEPK